MSQPYYQQVSGAFDRAAPDYDALYGDNRIMAWMRSVTLAVIQATFPPGSHLLEIGCGTGEEALTLSRAGYRVLATDISPAMIATARAKAEAHADGGVAWKVLPAGRLADLLDDYGPDAFDGAYASLGALNCEPRLPPIANTLALLLRPGASLVCSVMNRTCVWEIAWGMIRLHPRQAFRRCYPGALPGWHPGAACTERSECVPGLGRGTLVAGLASSEGRQSVPVRYYNPRTFAHAFAPHFQMQSARGLPTFLPPPYLDSLVTRRPALWTRLEKAERHLSHRFPFRALGDHFLLVLAHNPDKPARPGRSR